MLIGLLAGMLGIFATWVCVSVSIVGIGLTVRRLAGLHSLATDDVITAFWMGFCFVILILQLWHLAFAVSWHALGLVAALGVFGLVWNRAAGWAWLSDIWRPQHAPLLGVLVVCALWVANGATAAGEGWDYGVYHLSGVRWTKAFAIIPGLGNLHGRLAFNSSYYLYAAMLDVGPWSGRSNHLANGLLTAVLLVGSVIAVFRLWKRRDVEDRPPSLEAGFLAPALLLVLQRSDIASVITDLPVAIVLFVAAAKLFHLLVNPADEVRREAYNFTVLITLLAVAVCMKLTAVGFSFPAGLLATAVWVRRNRPRPLVARSLAMAAAIVLVLGGTWIARGVVLSGYPAYPSGALPFPVEWRVPAAQTRAEMAWTRHYGRWYYNPPMQSRGWIGQPDGRWSYEPEKLDGVWAWLPGWVSNLWRDPEHRERIVLPAGISLAGLLACAVRRRRFRNDGANTLGWLLLLPSLVAMAWWFVTAPLPRFGFFLFWIIAATVLAVTLWARGGPTERPRIITPLRLTLAVGLLPLAFRICAIALTSFAAAGSTGLSRLIVLPQEDYWLLPSPSADVSTFTTESGMTVNVPTHDQRCWDAPLPCTPQPAGNLALRRKDDLGSGFLNTNGQWKQQDFPDPRAYRIRRSGQKSSP